MKSLKIALAVVLSAMMLVSCDGNKNKEKKYLNRTGIKKIAKIYSRDDNDRDQLTKAYIWNGDQLERIDMYYEGEVYGSTRFTYENGKCVKSEDFYDDPMYQEYFATSYAMEWNGDQLVAVTDLIYGDKNQYTYENGKVARLDVYFYIPDEVLEKRAEIRRVRNMPVNRMEEMVLKERKSGAKAYSETPFRSWIYTYEGENIVKSVYLWDGEVSAESVLKFDQGVNPFYALFTGSYLREPELSRNNEVLQYDVEDGPEYPYDEYKYTYDEDNYPITVTNSYGMVTVYEYAK